MGAWGTGLFENDFTRDVRNLYIDQLKKGKDNETATAYMINFFGRDLFDEDQNALFWFAMADTQWNYGRLLPDVKENALACIEMHPMDSRWLEENEEDIQGWKKTVNALKVKLNTPQPTQKKVSRYRIYNCPWNIGDVFAYRIVGEYGKSCGYENHYIIMRKIENTKWWPGHTVPIVQFYNWIGNELPTIEQVQTMPYLKLEMFIKTALSDWAIFLPQTHLKKFKECITFLGNIPVNDIQGPASVLEKERCGAIGMEMSRYNKKLETFIIQQYLRQNEGSDQDS